VAETLQQKPPSTSTGPAATYTKTEDSLANLPLCVLFVPRVGGSRNRPSETPVGRLNPALPYRT